MRTFSKADIFPQIKQHHHNKLTESEDPMITLANSINHLSAQIVRLMNEQKLSNQEQKKINEKNQETVINLIKKIDSNLVKNSTQDRNLQQKDGFINNDLQSHDKNFSDQIKIKDNRVEARVNYVNFTVLKNLSQDKNKRNDQIINWVSLMLKEVFSVSFNLFKNGELDQNKYKAYCSQNIIRNMIKFSREHKITQEEIEFIDKTIVDDLLPYFLIKYPQSEENQPFRQFEALLVQRNLFQENQFDMVYKSKVKFQYEEDGNYNSNAMEFLNYIIQLTNLEVSQTSLFKNKDAKNSSQKTKRKQLMIKKSFENDTESFFKLVQDELTLRQLHQFQPRFPEKYKRNFGFYNQSSDTNEKQKYREKMKEYTSYLIGKKLGEDNKPFTQYQIESGKLQLRTSAMMRVMTKWCEELNEYFHEKNIIAREVPFRMQNGQQKYLQPEATVYLNYLLQREKQQIQNKLKQVTNNNYFHQFSCLNQQTLPELFKYCENQAMVGQFTEFIFKNNKNYLIVYFNLLVHGLKKACRHFSYFIQSGGYQKHSTNYQKQYYEYIYTAVQMQVKENHSKFKYLPEETPQLVTFRIGDLLRCKCSSKQNQIMALYKQIQRIDKFYPDQFKIIRIKNRLNSGNKDILMNILYKNTMVIEMQLAIKQQKSKFIECSNKFNHYFYEMKRAKFGAIMEMCSIWMSQDPRASFYENKIEALTQKKQIQCYKRLQKQYKHCCERHKIEFNNLPFVCRLCQRHYSESGMRSHHVICMRCSQYTCFYCEFSQCKNWTQKIKIVPELKQLQKYKIQDLQMVKVLNDNCGYGGLIINQSSKKKAAVRFFPYLDRQKNAKQWTLFSYENGRLRMICQFSSEQVPLSFLKENVICFSEEISQECKDIVRNTDIGEQINNFFISKVIQDKTKSEKNSMSIVNQRVTTQILSTKKSKSWDQIKRINLSNSYIDFNEKFISLFPNVEFALLNRINVTKSIPANIWTNITSLHLQSNGITDIDLIGRCQKLNVLDLSFNQIKIVPASIKNLKQLKKFYLSKNKIQQITEQISALENLNTLAIDCNFELKSLPESFGTMKNLQIILLANIQVKQLPKSLFVDKMMNTLRISLLPKLEYIPNTLGSTLTVQTISNIKAFQDTTHTFYNNLSLLQRMEICSNPLLKQLPQSIGTLTFLKQLIISFNQQLVCIPDNLDCLQSLIALTIEKNTSLVTLPNSLGEIKSLQRLIITGNSNLVSLPQKLDSLKSLQVFKLNQNPKITNLPQSLNSLIELKQLQLYQNQQLKIFPDSFDQLKSLQRLTVQSSKLLKSFSQLSSLQELTIKSTHYSSIFEDVLQNYSQLRYIQLFNVSEMETLPKAICKLTRLQNLVIGSCGQLENIPEQLSLLTSLNKFSICNCESIKNLPDVFNNMDCLQQIQIISNESLVSIPESIGNLSSLKKLTVTFNDCLSSVPQSLKNLTDLCQINIYYNEYLSDLPFDYANMQNLKQLQLSKSLCPDDIQSLLPNCKVKTLNF